MVSKKSDFQDIPRGGINNAVPGAKAFPARGTAGGSFASHQKWSLDWGNLLENPHRWPFVQGTSFLFPSCSDMFYPSLGKRCTKL